MADVLFITPNIEGYLHEEPLGTLLLGTILRNSGISVDILPFFHFGELNDFSAFLNRAVTMTLDRRPKIVSFYTRCDTYHITLTLAREIKQRCPEVWIVLGGPQSDITAKDTITQIGWVDFICCGEGESTIVPLFSSLLNNDPDLSLPGLVYKNGDEVVQNPRPALIEDLDTLPQIDYSLMQFVEGRRAAGVAALFPVDVGRGCPFGCTYCSTKTFWGRKYRLKSPEKIVSEIQNIHDRFGVTAFVFEHDMFTMKRSQVIDTCRLLKTLDFPVAWRCSARLDCLDEELIDIMVDAGLKSLFIGIETGSPRMQKLINKNLKLERVFPMLNYLVQKGLKATISFIYGFPEETEEDVAQTFSMIAAIEKLKGTEVQAHLCTFLPGTELSDRYRSEMTPAQGYSDIVGSMALQECQELIDTHPSLFQHFREYRTPLRTKWQYFSTFIRMWEFTRPVYQHLSEYYSDDKLMDMYYDFVQANEAVLETTAKLSTPQRIEALMKADRFVEKFAGDPYFDMIQDIYRVKTQLAFNRLAAGEAATDLYCVSPSQIRDCTTMRECQRGIYLVSVIKSENGSVSYQVRSRMK